MTNETNITPPEAPVEAPTLPRRARVRDDKFRFRRRVYLRGAILTDFDEADVRPGGPLEIVDEAEPLPLDLDALESTARLRILELQSELNEALAEIDKLQAQVKDLKRQGDLQRHAANAAHDDHKDAVKKLAKAEKQLEELKAAVADSAKGDSSGGKKGEKA